MSKIRIVTDSSITIEPELVEKYNITVVPLSVMVDGVIYSDSDLREEGRFLDMMKHNKVSLWRRKLMYWAVKFGGGSAYNSKSAEYIKETKNYVTVVNKGEITCQMKTTNQKTN